VSASPAAVLVEACVDGVDGAVLAERAGAHRLELCADLAEGGTTPSAGMIAAVKARVAIPVVVMVRPRGGDFLYSDDELEVMERDVVAARSLGADGVATGALTADGLLDAAALARLVRAAAPLPVTVHRAVDLVPDLGEALEQAVAAGARRMLTSGGAPSVREGRDAIAALVRQAGERIAIVAGGGVDGDSAAALVREAGVRELHVGGSVLVPSGMRVRRAGVSFTRPAPPEGHLLVSPDPARLRAVVEAAALGARRSAPG
jgi:copper homeostasis protein